MSIQLTTLDEVSNLLIPIVVMRVLKSFKEVSQSTVWKVRAAFVAGQVAQGVFFWIIHRNLSHTKDQRKVKVPKGGAWGAEEQEEEITYNEYDSREYSKLVKSTLFQLVISLFSHWKWGILHPLIIQTIGVAKSLFMRPIILAHMRGKEMQRPFEKNVLFGQALPVSQKKAEAPKKVADATHKSIDGSPKSVESANKSVDSTQKRKRKDN